MKGGHGDGGVGVPATCRTEREGGWLQPGVGSPSLSFQGGRGEGFDHLPAMEGGWTNISDGAMATELLANREGHQVGHGVGSPPMAPGINLGGRGDPKNP